MTEGLIETVTWAPGARAARYRVHWPYRGEPACQLSLIYSQGQKHTGRAQPVNRDNQQLDLVPNRLLTARNRVMPRLDLGNQPHQLLDPRPGRPEPVQHIRKRHRLLFCHLLEQLRPLWRRDEFERHRVRFLGSELGERRVVGFTGPAKEVDVLLEELEDGSRLHSARLEGVREGDERVRVKTVPLAEREDFGPVIPPVDPDCLTNLVL